MRRKSYKGTPTVLKADLLGYAEKLAQDVWRGLAAMEHQGVDPQSAEGVEMLRHIELGIVRIELVMADAQRDRRGRPSTLRPGGLLAQVPPKRDRRTSGRPPDWSLTVYRAVEAVRGNGTVTGAIRELLGKTLPRLEMGLHRVEANIEPTRRDYYRGKRKMESR